MRVLQTHALPLGYRARYFLHHCLPSPPKNEKPPANVLVVGWYFALG